MRKAALIDGPSLLFVQCVVWVITLFAAGEDALFFQSDPRSIFVASAAFGLALSLLLGTIALALSPFARARRAMRAWLPLGLPSIVVAALVLFVLDMLQGEFRIFGFLKHGYDEVINVVLALACLVWVGCRLARRRDRAEIEARVTRLSRALAIISMAGLIALVVQGRASRADNGERRHVVMIVIDGWPADYLHTFNPLAPARAVDSLFATGRVFHNMHTNATWTHGYFGALYLGSTAATFSGRARLSHVEHGAAPVPWDLWSALQRLGVATRWVVFHQNGIPESRALSRYRGFRSIHLTQRFAPVLNALGMDYNLVMCGPAARRMAASPRRRVLFNVLNAGADVEDALNDVLLREARAMHGRTDRTFLLLHTGWETGRAAMPAAWDESASGGERERVRAQIQKNDNRYSPGDEWFAEESRAKTALNSDTVGERIVRFFDRLRDERLLDDTVFILTADHGRIFERGRFWYGFHADEEVARVPMVVIGSGLSGADDRPRETIDITRTIMELLGGEGPAGSRAVSLLEPADRPFTVTVTQPSPRHHEWFVALYSGGRKYVCNVAAGGDGTCVAMNPALRDTLDQGPAVLAAIRVPLREALLELGLPPAELHPHYQAVLTDGGP
jgi:hypothetical protein